ncbi:hypothetical protein HPP92_012183 [Vanilla planifolia]|uniref:Uncharacterized protein n=1 Tax=Vanilla planifolia TaxID=51239 RepID=A0A835QXS0_VANPL|nr:hypothetical protein HPP92_012574 [Vanilla planifolia]KAG0484099.1 hypothetical protein HPP92_012183 [Vanilla planifolia]
MGEKARTRLNISIQRVFFAMKGTHDDLKEEDEKYCVRYEKTRISSLDQSNKKGNSNEASAGYCEKVILPSPCALPFTVSPDNYKESSQPSPVSVLNCTKKGQVCRWMLQKIGLDHEAPDVFDKLEKAQIAQVIFGHNRTQALIRP